MRTLLAVLAALCVGASTAAAQSSTGPLSLTQAMALGRERGVNAALARMNERIANARVGQRRADLLPSISLNGSAARQTLNLDEFGLPTVSGVTDPFNLLHFGVTGSQTLFDASALSSMGAGTRRRRSACASRVSRATIRGRRAPRSSARRRRP